MPSDQLLCCCGADRLQWDGSGYLALIEDCPQKMERFLASEEGQKIVGHPKARFYLISEQNQREIFNALSWEFLFLPFIYQGDAEIATLIEEERQKTHLIASEYSDFGIKSVKNIIANCRHLSKARPARSLFNQFKNVPALICGAGPSFDPALVKNWEGRAVIFAGGASLGLLQHHQLQPNIQVAFDPDPGSERTLMYSYFDAPLIYQNRCLPEILEKSSAPLYWIEDSGLHPLERWIYEDLGIFKAPFDAGWNVATFSAALAAELGCYPILFTGVDLEGTHYAEGIAPQKMETPADWKMAKIWMEDFKNRISSQSRDQWDTISPFSIDLTLNRLKMSVARSLLISSQMLEVLERIYPENPEEKGEFTLLEFDLYDEVAYIKIIEPLWQIWKYVLSRENPPSHFEAILNRILFYQRVLNQYAAALS